MKKRKYQETQTAHSLENINESSQSIAKNIDKMAEKLDDVVQSTKTIEENSNSKLPIIIAIITLIVTSIGVCIAYLQYKDSHIAPSEYEMYLSSEYTTLKVNAITDLTATLNFDTESISISAYFNSVIDGDTLSMIRNNETKWHKKVYFEHTGTYEVIATAIAPNGETIEASIEIEVIP